MRIRPCATVLTLWVGCLSMHSEAQTPPDSDAAELSPPSSVIQLEATIRGSKEQPNVLSIVPWQLPTRKTVDMAAQDWYTAPRITPITRDALKRQIKQRTTVSASPPAH